MLWMESFYSSCLRPPLHGDYEIVIAAAYVVMRLCCTITTVVVSMLDFIYKGIVYQLTTSTFVSYSNLHHLVRSFRGVLSD